MFEQSIANWLQDVICNQAKQSDVMIADHFKRLERRLARIERALHPRKKKR